MRFREPTKDDRRAWRKWVKARPKSIRDLIARRGFAPWTLYRLTTSGHRVTLISFLEPDGSPDRHAEECPKHDEGCGHESTFEGPSVTVSVDGRFNVVAFERRVHVDPDNLVECDLPGPFEPVGSAEITMPPHELLALDPKQVKVLLDPHRHKLRPFGQPENPQEN